LEPYKKEAFNKIYNLLFCDDSELYRNGDEAWEEYPWKELFKSDPSDETLQQIVNDNGAEARARAIAAGLLRKRGKPDQHGRVFGVIVEVGMQEGLDVLAAYSDGTARYLNYSEKLIIWEMRTPRSDELIGDLFMAAHDLIKHIGAWDGERLPPPMLGNARMSFLVSDGLFFGEGTFNALDNNSLAGPVIDEAVKLMTFLIENATDQSP
jgi:hypothetical protein